MTYVPVNNTARVTLEGTSYAQQIVNVLWFEFGEAITEAALNALLDALQAWWTARVATWLADNTQVSRWTATDMTTSSGVSVVQIDPIDGTVNSAAIPNNAALCVTHGTNQRGRSFRGRSYLGYIPNSQLVVTNSNEVLTTFAAGILAAFGNLNVDVAAAGVDAPHVVVSRVSAGAPRAAGVTTPVSQYRTNVFLDSQRRRLTGRGA